MKKKAILLETIFAILAIIIGLVVHEITHQWSIALVVALFVEILLQVYRFRLEYGNFLEKLAEGFSDKNHPFKLITQLYERTIPLNLLIQRPTELIFENYYDQLIKKFRSTLLESRGAEGRATLSN